MAQLVINLPALWETWVRSLGWEDTLEKGTATHSSILDWRIPWTSFLVHGITELDMTEQPLEKEMAAHSSVLAWRIPGTGEPGALPSVGSRRVGHD